MAASQIRRTWTPSERPTEHPTVTIRHWKPNSNIKCKNERCSGLRPCVRARGASPPCCGYWQLRRCLCVLLNPGDNQYSNQQPLFFRGPRREKPSSFGRWNQIVNGDTTLLPRNSILVMKHSSKKSNIEPGLTSFPPWNWGIVDLSSRYYRSFIEIIHLSSRYYRPFIEVICLSSRYYSRVSLSSKLFAKVVRLHRGQRIIVSL